MAGRQKGANMGGRRAAFLCALALGTGAATSAVYADTPTIFAQDDAMLLAQNGPRGADLSGRPSSQTTSRPSSQAPSRPQAGGIQSSGAGAGSGGVQQRPTTSPQTGLSGSITGRPPASSAPRTAAQPTGVLTLGVPISGTLRPGDEQLSSGEFTDRYTFEGQVGQRIRLSLQSSDFDAYLMLRGENVTSDNDDVSDGVLDSVIEVVLPYTGTYTVFATTVTPGESGAYALRAERVGTSTASATPVTLAIGRAQNGSLGAGDFQRQNGQYFDRYAFQGRAGQGVQIDLQSSAFDAYLSVRGPDGSGEENDDISTSDRNARVLYTLPVDGTYEVQVSSYSRGETGAYSVTMTDIATLPDSAPTVAGTLTVGTPVNGRLDSRDDTLPAGEHYDAYDVQLTPGRSYALSLVSGQFDAWIGVIAGDETIASNDDEAAGSTNAGVTFVAPANGRVRIVATSYGAGETGSYVLTLVQASGTSAQQPSPQPSTGIGRVFVLSVGISDYPGTGSDLAYCAEDAVKIRDAIRDAGALAPESIVLTDAQATRQNLDNAFRRASQVVGPNDVFLFFYSGHGGQVRSSDPTEVDGMDETLALYDQQISDTDFARMMDTVNARLAIISLDACHAGGFARDVVTQANRLGIFSSEEDVLSLVAGRFRAGGYLAHFLREAFSGKADRDPQDGVLTVGELTQSLRRDWAQHMQEIRTETGSSEGTYQNLVIERAAKVSDIVLGGRQATR